MLILLEGPDGAGKTTLANQLAADLTRRCPGDKVTLLHRGPPTSHPLDEYEAPLLSYRPGQGEHVICDRWHLGEVIYPRLLGRATHLDEPTLYHLELFLKSRGALLAHVTASTATLRRRLAANGDDLIDASHLQPLHDAYFAAVRETTLPTQLVVGDALDVTRLRQRASDLERITAALNPFVTYVGPRFPQLLLLGDTRNLRPGMDARTPAFVTYRATSGHYLLSALLSVAGPRVKLTGYLGLANACDVDDPIRLWQDLGEPLVVALGVRAAGRLEELDPANLVAPRYVDHPQYVRRFHHGAPEQYARHVLSNELPDWKRA